VNNARCVTDPVVRVVAGRDGVVGIFSMSFWLTDNPVPTVDSYVRRLEPRTLSSAVFAGGNLGVHHGKG
jgi:hypothetical protein